MMRPAELCSRLLLALDASEGRRRRRKRDTTPDAIGMEMKRSLLQDTVQQDPDPEVYEDWLLNCCVASDAPSGPMRAMALDILSDWHLSQSSAEFRQWFEQGAPSEDA
jgi:hypothetical protein